MDTSHVNLLRALVLLMPVLLAAQKTVVIDPCNRPEKCKKNTVVPDPDDCTSYFVCEHTSTWTKLPCAPGTAFHKTSKGCLHTLFNDILCEGCRGGGDFVFGQQITQGNGGKKPQTAVSTTPTPTPTPSPLVPFTLPTTPRYIDPCKLETLSLTAGCTTNTQIPHETDCNKYYVCENGNLWTPMMCTNNKHFSAISRQCEPEKARKSCYRQVCSGEIDPCNIKFHEQCDRAGHTVANPNNCAEYWTCLNSKKWQPKTCKRGFLFDIRTKQCEEASVTICYMPPCTDPIPSTTTTTTKKPALTNAMTSTEPAVTTVKADVTSAVTLPGSTASVQNPKTPAPETTQTKHTTVQVKTSVVHQATTAVHETTHQIAQTTDKYVSTVLPQHTTQRDISTGGGQATTQEYATTVGHKETTLNYASTAGGEHTTRGTTADQTTLKVGQTTSAQSTPNVEPTTAAQSTPKVELTTAAQSTPKVEPTTAAQSTPKVEPTTAAQITPKVEHTTVGVSTPKVEPTTAGQTTLKVEQTTAALSTSKVEPSTVVQSTPEVGQTTAGQTTSKVEQTTTAQSTPKVKPITAAQSTPKVEPTTAAQSTSEAKHTTVHQQQSTGAGDRTSNMPSTIRPGILATSAETTGLKASTAAPHYGTTAVQHQPTKQTAESEAVSKLTTGAGKVTTVKSSLNTSTEQHTAPEVRVTSAMNPVVSTEHTTQRPAVTSGKKQPQPTTQFTQTGEQVTSESTSGEQVLCPPENTYKSEVRYFWEATPGGVALYRECPHGATGRVSRMCDYDGRWGPVDVNTCMDKKLVEVLTQVEDLAQDTTPTQQEVDEALETLVNVTSSLRAGGMMGLANINRSVAALVLMNEIHSHHLPTLSGNVTDPVALTLHTMKVLDAADNILPDENLDSWMMLVRAVPSRAVDVMRAVESYGQRLSRVLPMDSNLKLDRGQNIAAYIKKTGIETVRVPLEGESEGDVPEWISDGADSITLEEETLERLQADGVIGETVAVSSVYYRTLSPFLPPHSSVVRVVSRVLSLSILGLHPGVTLDPPVRLQFRFDDTSADGVACNFWNYSQHTSYHGNWSREGVTTLTPNEGNLVTCTSNHLTNFAVLISPYKATGAHAYILNFISAIGCGASIAGLAFTLIVYIALWKAMKSHHAAVLLNLCVVLIIGNTIFLAGIDKTKQKTLCTIVAGALHYTFLVSFLTMMAEGVQLLLYIVFVFHYRRKRETAGLLLAAWVIPAVIVGVSMVIRKFDGYGNEDFCWITFDDWLMWTFLGPLLVVVAANGIILVIVLRRIINSNMSSAKRTAKEKHPVRSSVWNLTVMVPLLGITWVFGVFSVNQETIVFQYIFAVLNAFQGLYIFIFHCLLNKKLRDAFTDRRKNSSKSKNSSLPKKLNTNTNSRKFSDTSLHSPHVVQSPNGTKCVPNGSNGALNGNSTQPKVRLNSASSVRSGSSA